MDEIIIARGFIRHWRGFHAWKHEGELPTPDEVRDMHATYRGNLHGEKDETKLPIEALRAALRDMEEGEVVEVVVRRTGERDERVITAPWVLLRPHVYGPLPGAGGE